MLKKFIKTLLESFLQNKRQWVCSQSMPAVSSVNMGVPASNVPLTFIAPSDGFLSVRVLNATGCSTIQLQTLENTNVWVCLDGLNNVAYQGSFLPVKKGQTAHVLVRYATPGDSYVAFTPAVGAS